MNLFQKSSRVAAALTGALFAALAIGSAPAAQPAWSPEKNVEIVVGAGAGGGMDRTARIIQKIAEDAHLFDVPSIVVNKPGGGGNIGWNYLAEHPGDGRYIEVGTPTFLANHIVGKGQLNFTDFTPIAHLETEYIALVARADSPLRNGKDVAARLRKNPGALSIAFATSLGNVPHMAIAMAMKAAGVDVRKLRVVVFNTSSGATAALLGGHVDLMSATVSNVLPNIRAGKTRALAVASPQRLGGPLADAPTWREQGLDAVMSQYHMVVGAKGLSAAQIAYWNHVFRNVTSSAQWKQQLAHNLSTNDYMDSAETTRYLQGQYKVLAQVLHDLGLLKS